MPMEQKSANGNGGTALIAKIREYMKSMLGHSFFELEVTRTEDKDDYKIVYVEIVHMVRPERIKYKISINKKSGEVEDVNRIEDNKTGSNT